MYIYMYGKQKKHSMLDLMGLFLSLFCGGYEFLLILSECFSFFTLFFFLLILSWIWLMWADSSFNNNTSIVIYFILYF